MTEEEEKKTKEEKVSITIRGIDKELYENISKKAKELNITIGNLFNEAMKEFLSMLDDGLDAFQKITDRTVTSIRANIPAQTSSIIIKNIGEIKLTAADLSKADKPIIIINVKKVELSNDVTEELFREKIKAIKFSDEVVVPKNISIILVAQRCQLVKKITQF